MDNYTDEIIKQVKMGIVAVKKKTKAQLNAGDPRWKDLFAYGNEDQAVELIFDLYDNDDVAEKQYYKFCKKYVSIPRPPFSKREKTPGEFSKAEKREHWFNPQYEVVSKTQLLTSPCQACAGFNCCPQSGKGTISAACSLLVNKTIQQINDSLFIESKMPAALKNYLTVGFLSRKKLESASSETKWYPQQQQQAN